MTMPVAAGIGQKAFDGGRSGPKWRDRFRGVAPPGDRRRQAFAALPHDGEEPPLPLPCGGCGRCGVADTVGP